jgi:Clp amino terminal domain, pathogenicity island component
VGIPVFERYTERARRVIFFGRYEASHFGSKTIETEHFLLGILREDKNLTSRFVRNSSSAEDWKFRWWLTLLLAEVLLGRFEQRVNS